MQEVTVTGSWSRQAAVVSRPSLTSELSHADGGYTRRVPVSDPHSGGE